MDATPRGAARSAASMASALLAMAACALVPPAWAQDMDFAPFGWDFGDVAVGTSVTRSFHLQSVGLSPVWLYILALNQTPDESPSWVSPYFDPPGYASGAFSFVTDPAHWAALPLPREFAPGDAMDVEITFTPPALGAFSAWFEVVSNDAGIPPQDQVFMPLTGTGVAQAVPEPALLSLLCAGIAASFGPGLFASRRRRTKG